MCSISGFITQNPISPYLSERITKALLFYGRERGEQSGGVYVNGEILKRAINPFDLIHSKEFHEAFKEPASLALSHTRYPTCGGRTDAQAQPFRIGETITIHNGGYFNTRELKTKWGITKGSGVDSELVTSFIESYGIMKLPQFLESTSGVSAIACYHKGVLYFATHGNPIAYWAERMPDGNKIMIFASTKEILEKAIGFVFLNDYLDISTVKDNTLFRVTPKRLVKLADIKNGTHYLTYGDGYYCEDNWGVYKENKKTGEIITVEETVDTRRERLIEAAGEEFRLQVEYMNDDELKTAMEGYGLNDYEEGN